MEITWYSGEQTPSNESGSFLILTVDGNIAEAEWRDGHWFQYRWSAMLNKDEVRAWCQLNDVKQSFELFSDRCMESHD